MKTNNLNNKISNKNNNNTDSFYIHMNKKKYTLSSDMDYNIIKTLPALENRRLFKSFQIYGIFMNSDSYSTIKNSIAMKFVKAITLMTQKKFRMMPKQLSFNDFCYSIENNLFDMNLHTEIKDNELLLVYLKQLFLIFKKADGLNDLGNLKSNNLNSDYIQIYLSLFDSFWNKSDWEQLFPSMPNTAKKIKSDRSLLVNLLRQKENKFRIDKISNAFFEISGLGRMNDFLLISFLDFSFFTWLSNFGIINYLYDGNDTDPVTINITNHGRRMLEYM